MLLENPIAFTVAAPTIPEIDEIFFGKLPGPLFTHLNQCEALFPGLTFTFLRPSLYMQGLLNFRQSIQEKSAFFAAAGEAPISAVDVRGLADVARKRLAAGKLTVVDATNVQPESRKPLPKRYVPRASASRIVCSGRNNSNGVSGSETKPKRS